MEVDNSKVPTIDHGRHRYTAEGTLDSFWGGQNRMSSWMEPPKDKELYVRLPDAALGFSRAVLVCGNPSGNGAMTVVDYLGRGHSVGRDDFLYTVKEVPRIEYVAGQVIFFPLEDRHATTVCTSLQGYEDAREKLRRSLILTGGVTVKRFSYKRDSFTRQVI